MIPIQTGLVSTLQKDFIQINSLQEMKNYSHILLVLLILVLFVSINYYESSAFLLEDPVPGKLS